MTQERRWLILATLCLAVLLVAIDATVLNLAIPEITADLEPTSSQTLWILDIYSLVLAGLLVSAGTLSDRLGRKRVLLAGCGLFTIASVLAAFAQSAGWLIAARVLLGIGGATIMPSTLALIRNVFEDDRERRLAIGAWSAMAAAGAAVGPIIGGALLEHFWWGSVFLMNVPVMLVLLVIGTHFLPEIRTSLPGRWDWPSAVTSFVGLIALVYSIKHLAADGFTTVVGGAALVAVAAVAWFVRRQGRLIAPLIDIALFKKRSFTGAVLGNLMALLALSGLLLFVSQHLQLVLGYSPLEAGIRMLPLTAGALLGAPASAALAERFGTRAAISAGLLAAAAGMAAFGIGLDGGFTALAAALTAVGAGVGVALTATSDAILSAAPPSRAGAASSISETAYELGTGLGIAVFGSFLAAVFAAGLPDLAGVTGAARESLTGTLEASGALPTAAAAAAAETARTAFTDALSITAFVASGLLAVAAGVTSILLSRERKPVSG